MGDLTSGNLLTVLGAARRLTISRATLLRLISSGQLAAVVISAGRERRTLRIAEGSIQAFLATRLDRSSA